MHSLLRGDVQYLVYEQMTSLKWYLFSAGFSGTLAEPDCVGPIVTFRATCLAILDAIHNLHKKDIREYHLPT